MARRCLLPLAAAAMTVSATGAAHADAARAEAPVSARAQGVAVVAEGGASEAASALARAVYRSPLRPRALRDEEAQALVGRGATAGATPLVRELVELRAGLRGRDASARAVATEIVDRLHLEALLVVHVVDERGAEASLFLGSSRAFDAARYAPDLDEGDEDGGAEGAFTWSAAVASLARTMAPDPSRPSATGTVARASEATKPTTPQPFYKSPWLWGALGAAAVVGGAFFLATRDTSPESVRLTMDLPR